MKWIQLLILFVVFALAKTAVCEEFTIKEPRWKQVSQAHGFILVQQTAIKLIEEKFPDLEKDIKAARFAFNSTALGESIKGLEEELSEKLGDKWPDYKKAMAVKMDSFVSGRKITRQQAVDFLHEVRQRAKGAVPDSILATLLSAHPRFSKQPELEMSNGWKHTFRTKSHPKAKGVDFSISFPASWSKQEGLRPNVIQLFRSSAGHGLIMCNLLVKDLPLPAGYKLTAEELKEFFQPNELKGMIPDGGTFIDAKEMILEGLPAGMIIHDQIQERLELKLAMRMTQFVTVYESSMISIQFMVTEKPDSTDTLDDLQEHFLPTFRAIASTFVLNDLYKANSISVDGFPSREPSISLDNKVSKKLEDAHLDGLASGLKSQAEKLNRKAPYAIDDWTTILRQEADGLTVTTYFKLKLDPSKLKLELLKEFLEEFKKETISERCKLAVLHEGYKGGVVSTYHYVDIKNDPFLNFSINEKVCSEVSGEQ